MKKNIIIIILLTTLFTLSTWNCKQQKNIKSGNGNLKETISINIGNRLKELKFSFSNVNNSDKRRIWKKINTASIFKIGGIENELLLNPSRIKIDHNDNMYILDWADCSIKKFDKNGIFIQKYGKKGKGPGEFTKAFDFDVIGEGNIVVLGPNDGKFAVFKNNGIVEEVKCTLMPVELCFIAPNEVVTFQIMDIISQVPFQKINYKNNVKTGYQNIFDKGSIENENFGMLPFLLGNIHRYKLNKLVYVSSIMGYVITYNDFTIDKVFKLIDEANKAGLSDGRTKINGIDAFTFPRKEDYLFESSNIYGNNLYVFCDQVRKEPDEFVIDIYSLTECNYKYSIILKGMGNILNVFATDNKLYIIKKKYRG